MDPLLILVAFIFGFAVYRVGLPPLVGFLVVAATAQEASRARAVSHSRRR